MSPEEIASIESAERGAASMATVPPALQAVVERLDRHLRLTWVAFDLTPIPGSHGRQPPPGSFWGRLCGANELGVWWDDAWGSTHLMGWRRVGEVMRELERADD